MSWSRNIPYTLAVGSYREDYTNKIDIIKVVNGTLKKVGGFEHEFPPTKIAFAPVVLQQEYLATVGDALRVWEVDPQGGTKLKHKFSHPKVQPT